jgi:hypothetical protein
MFDVEHTKRQKNNFSWTAHTASPDARVSARN